jgi:predicted Zn-dependent protease
MRLRRNANFVLVVLALAGCATVAKPPIPGPSNLLPDASSYRSADDAPRLLDAFDKALADRQGSVLDLTTPQLSLYSNLLLAAGRLPSADQALMALDERQPGTKSTLFALVLVANARGDATAAQARLQKLEVAFPGDPDAAGLRAQEALAKGDRPTAKALWLKVLSRGEDAGALAGLVGLALDAKDPKTALTYADRAVLAFPDDDQLWSLHSQVQIGLEHYLAARKDLDKALELSPGNPWHRLDRGKLAWLHLYQPELALGDLEYATSKLSGNFFGWAALGEVAEDQERPRQAYDAWLRALSLEPNYRFAYPSAAMLAFRFLDFTRATTYAREAAKDHPGEYAFPFVEALSLRALGQVAASNAVLEKARPRFKQNPTVDEMFRFLLTPGTDSYLNTAMNLEKQDSIRLRLRFYQGCAYALQKSKGSAKAAFDEVAASELKRIPEIGAAREWLANGP